MNITTYDNVLNFLHLKSGSIDSDLVINSGLDIADALIVNYCNQNIFETTINKTVYSKNYPIYNTPLGSIVTTTLDDDPLDHDITKVGSLTIVTTKEPSFKVQYTYGFNSGSLPDDLVMVATRFAANYVVNSNVEPGFNKFKKTTQTIVDKSGTLTTIYASNIDSFEREILNKYRMVKAI